MVYYLIICRSLTYAQRTAAVLERAGITAHIMRTPSSISHGGCSHAVKVSERAVWGSPPAVSIFSRPTAATRR